MEGLIEDALDTSPNTGIFQFQHVLSKLTNLVTPCDIMLITQLIELPTLSNISLSGATRPLELQALRKISKRYDTAVATRDLLRIQLPLFTAPIQLDTGELSSDTKAHLGVFLEGAFPQDTLCHEMTATEHVSALLSVVHRIITEVLNSRSFISLQALASDLTDAVLERRHELSSAVDVRKVHLRALLREGEQSNRTIERASAIKKVESSATVEQYEGKESSKELSRLKLKAEPERKVQTEIEADTFEADPQSLDARHGVSAAGKQGGNQASPDTEAQTVFIALGSNVGDRLGNIENACREMDLDPDIRIVRTSPLYETDPMYVSDQDRFLNGACEVTIFANAIYERDQLTISRSKRR